MESHFANQFELFDQFPSSPNLWGNYQLSTVAVDCYHLTAKKGDHSETDFFINGLTHGNEWIGLYVINQFLQDLEGNHLLKSNPLNFAVALANRPAAMANKRFLQMDLNRSFEGESHEGFQEHERAQILLSLIRKLRPRFVLDLHQTNEPSESPFWVVPKHLPSLQVINALAPHFPVLISQKENLKKGKTLTRALADSGIACATLELGQVGVLREGFPLQVKMAMQVISNLISIGVKPPGITYPQKYFELFYTFENPGFHFALNPGLKNFQLVQEGEPIGTSETKILNAPHSGCLLFPKYGELQKKTLELFELVRETECPL